MYLLFNYEKLSASIAKSAILNGGITLVIFLLIISITCFIIYFFIDDKDK